MSNLELLQRIAIEEDGVEKTYETPHGPESFVIARFRGIDDATKFYQHIESRNKAMKATAGKLPVVVPADLYEPLADKLPTAKKLADGKYELLLSSEPEIHAATVMELGVRHPAFTWAEAVLFTKLNWAVTGRIINDWRILNGEEAKTAAKKGSRKTEAEPADSGD